MQQIVVGVPDATIDRSGIIEGNTRGKEMERETGFEPATYTLAICHFPLSLCYTLSQMVSICKSHLDRADLLGQLFFYS